MAIKRWFQAVWVALFLSVVGLPVFASQGGGVHFGDYTLAAGDSISDDLIVFGSATLESGSSMTGDLACFGPVTIAEDATLDGDLSAFGEADIAGTVQGNAFVAGAVTLRETARIEGDLSAAGTLQQEEGSIVEGDITPYEDSDFSWDFPFTGPVVPPAPQTHWGFGPAPWVKLGQNVATLVVLALFAILVASLWPRHMQRAANTIAEAPWISMGIGALALLVAAIVMAILFVSICLALFGFVGVAIAVVVVAFGWVSIGFFIGEHILKSLFHQDAPTVVLSALTGTVALTLLAQLVSLNCIGGLLVWPLFALAAGAAVLTRMGTMPYAVRGNAVAMPLTPPQSAAPQSAAPQPPMAEAPEEDAEEELPSPEGDIAL